MCWNKEVSFLTGAFGTTVSLYLYKRNKGHDRWFSVVLLSISVMQWAEFILWYDIEKNKTHKTNLNRYISIYILPLIITLQPLAVLLGTQLSRQKFNISNNIKFIYIVYAIVIFIGHYNLRKINYTTVGCIEKKCSAHYSDYDTYLMWNFRPPAKYIFLDYLAMFLHYSFLGAPLFLLYKESIFYKIMISQIIIAFINFKSASQWCLYVNILAIIFLFEN